MSIRSYVAGAVDLVAPRLCAGCGGPAPSPVCRRCWRAIAGVRRDPRIELDAAVHPVAAAFAGHWYGGPVARMIVARKDGGRRDLRESLAVLLMPALLEAARAAASHAPGSPLVLVPAPSSAAAGRRRGEQPVADLVRIAASMCRPARPWVLEDNLLRLRRGVRDQSGLGRTQRIANLDGAVSACRAVHGAVVLVDDVITTGATMSAAARALLGAGAPSVHGAAIAATPRGGTSAPGRELARR